jgi:hypothetical protein
MEPSLVCSSTVPSPVGWPVPGLWLWGLMAAGRLERLTELALSGSKSSIFGGR